MQLWPCLLGASLSLLGASPVRAQDSTTHTRVVMLGTGTPNPDPDRSGPAVAIVTGGRAYLVDAGAGVVRRAAAAARNGLHALDAPRLDVVFVTHLHSDHTIGLPDLLLTPWVLTRTMPLRVFGPPGIAEMMGHLRQAYDADIRVRVDGLEPANETGFAADVKTVRPGIVYRDSAVTVRAIPVPHGDWKAAFAYRFETRDRTIVVSGDTRPDDAIVTACNGCDVLVHEAYSADSFTRRPPEWQRYHARAHTSTTQLAALAARARPKLLVLYHQLYWGVTDDDLVREIRAAGYTGAVVSARDLGVY
jgi:ribonuclease BN (tRNA processing enzyme)